MYWTIPDKHMGSLDIAAPLDEWENVIDADQQRKLFGHATAYCTSPSLKFYERPEKDGACVVDGSEYMANLITGEDFGCALHVSK